MSWDDEFQPETDPAEAAQDPGHEPGDEQDTPDPEAWLDDLDEETRERVEALAAARAQSAAQDTEKRFRSGLGRWGKAQQHLNEQLGLVVDEHGNVAPRDPEKLQQFVQRFGTSTPQKTEAPAEDAMPDPTYDPKGFRDWMGRQIDSAATAKAQAMVEPLRAGFVRQAVPAAEQAARQMLAESGFGALVEDEQFSALFSQSLQGIPQEQWGDPTAVETVAFMLIPTLKRRAAANPTRTQQPSRDPQRITADMHRATLSQTGPSANGTRRTEGRYSAEEIAEARANGMTPEEWEAMSDPDAAWQFADRKNRRGRR